MTLIVTRPDVIGDININVTGHHANARCPVIVNSLNFQ